MPLETRHFKEEQQELLDDRLNPDSRFEVEQHLESCEECRQEFEALRWTKQISRQRFAPTTEPTNLQEDILKALDLEDKGSHPKPIFLPTWHRLRRAILAYGLVLVVIAGLTLGYFVLRATRRNSAEVISQTASLPSAVARDYWNYRAEKVALSLETDDPQELEKFFVSRGIAFDTRVFDLSMMNYHLVGGRIHQLSGRQSALFVYRGKDSRLLMCQMYRGQVTELPPAGATLRENKGTRFHIYKANDLTMVFWQEGAITCVLTSDSDQEEVVQLAFAKSMKV
jgi:anti-sigma factor RsiW